MILKSLKIAFKKINRNAKVFFIAVSFLFLCFFTLNLIFPFRPKIEFSPTILSHNNELLHSYLTTDEKWRMYTTLDEISPTLRKAIIHKEDQYFYYHFGVNPLAILRAAFNNIVKSKRTSGASTITMQVARMLEPKKRSYGNKIIEIFRAIQLEWQYSKHEILQLYLNLVPYGGNIEGVKAASLIYFEKMPDHLSLAEVTTLAIIPNRPNSLRLGRANDKIIAARNQWLQRFETVQLFESGTIADALTEGLTATRTVLPRVAPHLSYRLKRSYPQSPIIRSSTDLNMQLKVESIVGNYSRQLYGRNIKNAAAVVVDNETMQVKAYVGSADYYDARDGGQVDGIRAIRSPGSTLKPFLYGIAIDKGMITPKTVIEDVPINFRGYQPRNYQETFNGNVTIEYALSNSLNIPAVKVLDELTPRTFVNALIDADFRQIAKDRDFLGLSTALGGCGVTLEELIRLYSAFAHDGQLGKLNFLATDSLQLGRKALSKSANYMISEILTSVTRPDLPNQWKNSKNLPKVAWKTGTSFGRKDAWSIGYNKKYTVGVWVGNFSGEGVAELSGAETASPLLFNIFNAIDQASAKEWFRMPEGVNFRYVCTESGQVPDHFCTSQELDYYLPGISKYHTCTHKQQVFVSADSTISYCNSCLPENGYVKALFPNLKPEIISFYESENINYIKIPPHNPDCERVFTESAPRIVSPIDKLEYLIDEADSMQVLLSSQTANNVSKIYWYINDQYYGSAQAGEDLYFTPPEGNVKISCADDKGRHTDIEIEVKKIRF